MGSSAKILAGISWSIVVNLVTAIYGFIATPLLIKYFGRSDYGLIALAQSVNAYMALMDLGLSSTNVRFFSNWLAIGDELRVNKLMRTCTAFYGCIGIINAIVLIIVAIYADSIFNVTDSQGHILSQMLLILAVIAIINWYTSCFNQIISATENVAWVQKRTLVTKLIMLIVVVITLTLKLSLFQYFLGVSVAGIIVLPATIRKIRKETPYVSFLAQFDAKTFKEILPYSLGIFSFGFFQFSYNNLKIVIVGMQGTVSAITDYGVMVAIASLVSMIGGVFIQALLPSSSRIVAKEDKEAYYRVAYKGTHYITMILCFCAFGLMTVDRDLIMVYVGKDFIHLIPWLNIWLLLTITSNVSCISSLIMAGSNVKPLAYSSAVASISAILATWFAVPYFEAGGVVIGMIVYNAIQQLFYYIIYWNRVLRIDTKRIFLKTDVPFVLIGSVVWLAVTNIPHTANHWLNIFLFGSCFAILYMAISYVYLDKEDRDYILDVVRRK